jgi:hypothetical protein
MKISLLLMIISVFVSLSYIPVRGAAKQRSAVPPDTLPA